MSIQKDLKKEGIEVINKLDTLISNDICKSVSRRIIETFPDYDKKGKKLIGFIGGPPCPDFSIAGKNKTLNIQI